MTAVDTVNTIATTAEARELTNQLCAATRALAVAYAKWADLVVIAYERRAWAALGYPTWDAYVAAEVPTVRVGRTERRELVSALTDAGMSTRAIAAPLGVDNATVHRDRKAGVANATPAEGDEPLPDGQTALTDDGEVVDAELVDDDPPRAVTGVDGKTYRVTHQTPPEPGQPPKTLRVVKEQPEPEPEVTTGRDPLWDLCRPYIEALAQLDDAVAGLQRLHASDEFKKNREVFRDYCRDLERDIGELKDLAAELRAKPT